MSKSAHSHDSAEQRAGVRRLEVVGEVISDKLYKTISVQFFRRVRHEKYGKYEKKTSVYKAHDEKNEAKKGDKVLIQMARPLSKTKRWRLLKVIEKAEQDIGAVNV
jgi:small subunit ribosomal protein S17